MPNNPLTKWHRGRVLYSGWFLRSDGFREYSTGHLDALTFSERDDGFMQLDTVPNDMADLHHQRRQYSLFLELV